MRCATQASGPLSTASVWATGSPTAKRSSSSVVSTTPRVSNVSQVLANGNPVRL